MVIDKRTPGELLEEIKTLRAKILETQEIEERFKKFSEASSEGIIIHVNDIIMEANKSAGLILDCDETELIGRNSTEFIKKDVLAAVLKNVVRREDNEYELPIITSGGKEKICDVKAKSIIYKGSDARVLVFRDVSTRIKAQQELIEINERYKKLSEASFEGIFIHDNGIIIETNEACARMFGHTIDEINGRSAFDFLYKDDWPKIIERLKKQDDSVLEIRALYKDGSLFFAEIKSKGLLYHNKPMRVVAIRDVSERKSYETKLQQGKQDYENLIQNSPDGIFILDEQGEILFANPSAHQILGITSLDVIKGKSTYDFILPNYHAQIKERAELLKEGHSLPFMRVKAIRLDCSLVEIEYKPVIIDYQGRKAMLVVYHDIDYQQQLTREKTRSRIAEETNYALKKEIEERKIIEAKLSKSENQYKIQSAKLKSVIESSSHLVWTVDNNISLTSFNENFADCMENSYNERPTLKTVINKGKFANSKTHNDLRTRKYKAAFAGTPQHFEISMDIKKGNAVWLEIYLNPIFDESGIVKEVSGIAHDITEKKEAAEKTKQSLKEKEVLLKEVHHRVKNNLQVISSILNLQSSYIADEKVVELLRESQDRIKSMSFIHESLYQAEDFSSVKFADYIQHLTNNLMLSYKPKAKNIALTQNIDNVFLNLDFAIPCGLIINELVSNALKYAFSKMDKGKLSISIDVDKRENVKIIIADNGPGLPKGINYRNTQSLGLQLVMVLVSQLKGEIKLNNKKGAQYTITFNKRIIN